MELSEAEERVLGALGGLLVGGFHALVRVSRLEFGDVWVALENLVRDGYARVRKNARGKHTWVITRKGRGYVAVHFAAYLS